MCNLTSPHPLCQPRTHQDSQKSKEEMKPDLGRSVALGQGWICVPQWNQISSVSPLSPPLPAFLSPHLVGWQV